MTIEKAIVLLPELGSAEDVIATLEKEFEASAEIVQCEKYKVVLIVRGDCKQTYEDDGFTIHLMGTVEDVKRGIRSGLTRIAEEYECQHFRAWCGITCWGA